jgi:hypothetical protein
MKTVIIALSLATLSGCTHYDAIHACYQQNPIPSAMKVSIFGLAGAVTGAALDSQSNQDPDTWKTRIDDCVGKAVSTK